MEIKHVTPRPDRLKISGRLDSALVAGEIRKAVEAIFGKGRFQVILDFAGVEYIASPALRVLVELRKQARDLGAERKVPGDIIIAHLRPRIKEVFDLTGFTTLFAFEEDAEGTVVFTINLGNPAD